MDQDVPSEIFQVSNGDDFVEFRVYSMNSGFIRVDVKVSSFGFSGAHEADFRVDEFENFARGLADFWKETNPQAELTLGYDFELKIFHGNAAEWLEARGHISYDAIGYDADVGEYQLSNRLEFAFELTVSQLVKSFRNSWLMKYAEMRH